MKKIVMFWIVMVVTLFADEYPSLHGGTFLSTMLNETNFMNSGYFEKNYSTVVYTNAAKSTATGKPYYPQGWSKFKIYLPAGLDASVSISTVSNASLRCHITFGADGFIDHYSPQPITSFPYGFGQTVEKIVINAGQFVYSNVFNPGWLYFDMVNDSANSYTEYNESVVALNIQLVYQKSNNNFFDNWLSSTYFLTPTGDPSGMSSTMNIVDVTTPDAPIARTIALDYGGSLFDGVGLSSSSSSIGSALPGPGVFDTSSSSSSLSYNPCASGYHLEQQTICPSSSSSTGDILVPGGSGGGSSSSNPACYITQVCISNSSSSDVPPPIQDIPVGSSSSSSSAYVPQKVVQHISLTTGWNLISVPIKTSEAIELNTLLNQKATIAWKFVVSSSGDYSWEKWSPPITNTEAPPPLPSTETSNQTFQNGDGLFVGVPSDIGNSEIVFSAYESASYTKFEGMNFLVNKWYLLGFPYNITVGSIKAQYPNSVVWIMENGRYKRIDDPSFLLNEGQGFWFKYK